MNITNVLLAIRNIRKQPVYTTLNVVGLAIGIAAGLVIALYIQDELSFDKAFADHKNIYRVHFEERAESSPLMAPEMREAFPEISSIGRFSYFGKRVINVEGELPIDAVGYFADSSIVNVFTIDVLAGNARESLSTSNTSVITASLAKRLFGNKPAVGQVLKLDNRRELVVGAVIADLPPRTHLEYDFLVSMKEFYANTDEVYTNNRLWSSMYTYVRFKSNDGYIEVASRMHDFIGRFFDGIPEKEYMVSVDGINLMPLTDIHLRSNLAQEMRTNGNIMVVYVFAVIEALILIIACANFMSLFTTQAIKRMREVGMRKIMGAKKKNLIVQFMTEVVLLTCASVILALGLYQAVLPFYNSLTGNTLGLLDIINGGTFTILACIVGVIFIFSGLYPAYFISTFKTISFLRESKLPNSIPNRVRNGLIIFQFFVSASLIASTLLIHDQMKLIGEKALGFKKDHLINVQLNGYLWYKAVHENPTFVSELMNNAEVVSVGLTSNLIGDDLGIEGAVPVGKEKGDWPLMRMMGVNAGYLPAMNIDVILGRNFSNEFNDSSSVILNEAAAKALQLHDPIGQVLVNDFRKAKYNVVGVIKDYHFASLHHTIEPLLIQYQPGWAEYASIRIKGNDAASTVQWISNTVKKIAPNSLFNYEFLDRRVDTLYDTERNMSRVFNFFSILAIVIACLGLLSMCAYTVESRTKEIGIRKILGASLMGILRLLSSGFFKLIVISLLIAVPVSWYAMHEWLQNFAYHVELDILNFAIASGLIGFIAMLTIGFHTFHAAMSNPVKSLRYE